MSRLPALLLAAALAGCAGLPSPTSTAARPPAAAIVDFELAGRISVRHGEASYFARLSWQHDAVHDDILLSTPLGQAVAQLFRDTTGARLLSADGRRIEAADWDGLAAQAFGAELPLARLTRWMVADAPVGARRDASGRPLAFRQDGWSVAYDRYESEAPDALPISIEARRDDIELRVRVDAWQAAR